jgi:hypothetical protein
VGAAPTPQNLRSTVIRKPRSSRHYARRAA